MHGHCLNPILNITAKLTKFIIQRLHHFSAKYPNFASKCVRMKVLLVAATYFEIRPLLDKLPLIENIPGTLFTCRYKNIVLDVLISGVGMISTAVLMGRQLALQHYDLAVNGGIAGTFDPNLSLGTLVNVTEDAIADLGAEDGERFISVFELGLQDPDAPPYIGGKLKCNPSRWSPVNELRKVCGITSNTIRGNAVSIKRIRDLFKPDIESMEGAAFFYACNMADVPCVQIRAISNLVEERDKSRWNIDLSLQNLNLFLERLLNEISQSETIK